MRLFRASCAWRYRQWRLLSTYPMGLDSNDPEHQHYIRKILNGDYDTRLLSSLVKNWKGPGGVVHRTVRVTSLTWSAVTSSYQAVFYATACGDHKLWRFSPRRTCRPVTCMACLAGPCE